MRHFPNSLLTLFLLTATGCATANRADETVALGTGGTDAALVASELEALWTDALAFDVFLEGVRARREAWHGNYRDAAVADDLVERLGVMPGHFRLLAVSQDGCTDSVINLPVLARLVERVPGLEFRIVDAGRGRALMERYPTPDGRAATPTLVLLDDDFDVVGCWIERAAPLQSWYLENKDTKPIEEIYRGMIDWYDEDRGRAGLQEIVSMVEAAARGQNACK